MAEIGHNGLFAMGAACDRCGHAEYGVGINPVSEVMAEGRMAIRERLNAVGNVAMREHLCLDCVTAEDRAAGFETY